MVKRWFAIVVTAMVCVHVNAQISDNYIKIGQPYPDATPVTFHTARGDEKISLSNWKGKPLIVDFFSSFCVVCLSSLPKMEKLREHFEGKVQFLLVAKDDKVIRKVYNKYREKFNLKFDIGYDSVLHKDMHDGYPLYVWIDADGIVQAVTRAEGMTQEKIEAFVQTRKAKSSVLRKRVPFDSYRPFGSGGNGGADTAFLSRSMFTAWKKGIATSYPPDLSYMQPPNGLQILGATMTDFYRYVCLGTWIWDSDHPYYSTVFPSPMLENGTLLNRAKDTAKFCYSLWLSPSQQEFTDKVTRFREDVVNQFGYEARVEYRNMPYIRLTVRPGFEQQLMSKSDSIFFEITHTGIVFRKVPMERLVSVLFNKYQFEDPIINETGIEGEIDLDFEAVLSDMQDVKAALYKKGIVLDRSTRPMKVIILTKKCCGHR